MLTYIRQLSLIVLPLFFGLYVLGKTYIGTDDTDIADRVIRAFGGFTYVICLMCSVLLLRKFLKKEFPTMSTEMMVISITIELGIVGLFGSYVVN